jgi:hypothetical protein
MGNGVGEGFTASFACSALLSASTAHIFRHPIVMAFMASDSLVAGFGEVSPNVIPAAGLR